MTELLKLRRFLETRRAPAHTGERCELCGVEAGPEHPHVVDVEKRGILCVCRPCYLLFAHRGAGGNTFRAVPDRVVSAPIRLTRAQWDSFQIPVGLAFFFHNSKLGRTLAFYPSPAGATESELPLDAWDEMASSNPALQTLEPDVEALLVRRSADIFDSYIVPIDTCYELAGRIRRHWRGFHGGDEAWREIDGFFEQLSARAAA